MKKEIMRRAWEIKKETDHKTRNNLLNKNITRELKENEKAVFSFCLKIAWSETKKAAELSTKYDVSLENGMAMAEKETELGGNVSWKIWKKYNMCRAYYTVDNWSKYANNKKENFITLAA